MKNPFHEGELAVQGLAGERSVAVSNSRMIATQIPAPAVAFVARQQLCVLGWRDKDGFPWAFVITGEPGFLTAGEDRRTLFINAEAPTPSVTVGDPVGVLLVELSTRRRLRINGAISSVSPRGYSIDIEQAFPNCPKYIQRRRIGEASSVPRQTTASESGETLTDPLRSWISQADTFFVASAHPSGPVDASHRGGAKGFVEVGVDTLRVPDYPGNSLFNTLGNLHLNPQAGLNFPDFGRNRQLQIVGSVSLELHGEAQPEKTGGTGRWWTFKPHRWMTSPLRQPFNWELVDESPWNP